jgi:hypothetical protein
LADIVASSFFNAADALSTRVHETRHAEALKDRMWSNGGIYADNGVSLQPTPPWRAKLTEKQKTIFRFYGYRF